MREYWIRVASEAARRTLAALGLVSWEQIVIKGLIAIAIILALIFFGSTDASRDEMVVRVAIIAIIVLLFPIIFVWNLVGLPPELDRQGRDKIGALDKRLEPKLDIQFDESDERFVHYTHNSNHPDVRYKYVSVRPVALTSIPLKNCVGYLNRVDVWKVDKWEPTSFGLRSQLEWGNIKSVQTDIDDATFQTLNIFITTNQGGTLIPCVKRPLNKDSRVFENRNDVFRFEIVVMSPDYPSASKTAYLRVALGESWDDVTVERLDS